MLSKLFPFAPLLGAGIRIIDGGFISVQRSKPIIFRNRITCRTNHRVSGNTVCTRIRITKHHRAIISSLCQGHINIPLGQIQCFSIFLDPNHIPGSCHQFFRQGDFIFVFRTSGKRENRKRTHKQQFKPVLHLQFDKICLINSLY